ncbi:MAG: hypothetical protein U0324_47455 [Polyangiales bacterium]
MEKSKSTLRVKTQVRAGVTAVTVRPGYTQGIFGPPVVILPGQVAQQH